MRSYITFILPPHYEGNQINKDKMDTAHQLLVALQHLSINGNIKLKRTLEKEGVD